MKTFFLASQFHIEPCPHSCIAHILLRDAEGNVCEMPLSLDNCEFIIEELEKIIEQKIDTVPIHPTLRIKK